MEQQKDEDILAEIYDNLKTMLGSELPPPSKFMVSRWGKEEFTRGSYSSRMEGRDFDRDAAVLREPVGDNVWFAGEATSQTGWASTTVGAFETGEEVANNIVKGKVQGGKRTRKLR